MGNNKDLVLSDLIYDFINRSGKQQLFADRTIVEKWPEYIGEMCAAHTTCISAKNGIVKVKVPNAALRFELIGNKNTIIDRINADYTVPVVKDIMFL